MFGNDNNKINAVKSNIKSIHTLVYINDEIQQLKLTVNNYITPLGKLLL